MKLKDKVAIVTGAADGIGKAIALALAKEGAKVAVTDIDGDGAKRVSQEINSSRGQAIAIKTDVTKFEEVKTMVSEVRKKLGEIDILVNNAGGGRFPKPAWETSVEDWHSVIALCLHSVFYCCHEVVGRMVERKSGRIINISSCAGILGTAESIGYSSGKAGIYGLTKSLAKEVALHGVTVNSVSPGPIGTERLYKFLETVDEKRKKVYLTASGLNRLGRPEEVAFLVTFLASEEAAFITGQDHVVGGLRNLGF
jgi:NAD(P)-dependent dehydrogenase (short-subunit alcohol dehydrogenase family)